MKVLPLLAAAFWLYAPGAEALTSYFEGDDVEADNVSMFPKWTGMLSRYRGEAKGLDDVCGHDEFSTCRLRDWQQFMEGLRGKPLATQMAAVNRFVNRYPYIEDIVNWGMDDYWETVYEFQRKNGDCEDYAIAKYTSLRALGVDDEDLRVTIVQDLNLGGVIHAILLVKTGGETYVLDNQIKQVLAAHAIYHYKPIYSINESHWWRHVASK